MAEHPTEVQKHKDFIESLKVSYDLFKHITTLATGSLILATLLDKFIKAPEWAFLIGVTFSALLLSIIGSLALMFTLSQSIGGSGKVEGLIDHLGVFGTLSSVGGFIVGLGSLIAFTLINLNA